MNSLLLTVGNIYVDHNIFGVNAGNDFKLELGKDYAAESGERVLGGSAVNVAMQAKKLGIDVGFVGKTGTDDGSHEVITLLKQKGIRSDLVAKDSDHSTSMTVNLIDKSGGFAGVHYGDASKTLTIDDIDLGHELFSRAAAVYFGGTAKQPKLFAECESTFRSLAERNIKVFYDPNRFTAHASTQNEALLHSQLAHVEGYMPNEEELLQATGKESLDDALDFVIAGGVGFVALKLGSKGCRIKTADQDFTVSGKQVQVITTVGAGDCFNAILIAGYLKGSSLEEAAELATAAAAIKVSQNIWPNEQQINAVRDSRF